MGSESGVRGDRAGFDLVPVARRCRSIGLDTPCPDSLPSRDLGAPGDAVAPGLTLGFDSVLERETELTASATVSDPSGWSTATRSLAAGAASRVASAFTVLMCLAACAAGQQPAPADPLAEVRQQVAFTSAQDSLIDAWLTARVDQLKRAVRRDGAEAAAEFRQAFQSELNNPQSTSQYLDRLTERLVPVAAAEFAAGDESPLMVQVALAWVLGDLNRVSTSSALSVGLRHQADAVRYLCATAYAKLRAAIAVDAATTRSVIALLKTAGVTEANGVVRGAIYQALGYEEARHVPEVVGALVEIFAARAEARRSGQQRRGDRAEVSAFEYLYRVRGDIAQAQRPRLVQQLAALLALDVERYGSAVPGERRDIEWRIEVGELLIETLTNGAGGDVRGAMKKGGEAVEQEMAGELLKWVGGEDGQGALNSAPWNVPVGGWPQATAP